MEAEKSEKEALEVYNQRMASMDESYELNDDDRKIIASDLQDLDEDQFKSYWEKMAVLLSQKNKENLKVSAEAEEASKEPKQKAETAEAQEETSESNDEVVDSALEQADKQEDIVPASVEASSPTLYDKYKSAFGLDQFDIKN